MGRYGVAQGLLSAVTRNRATGEQERIGRETAAKIEKILRTVLYEAHGRQTEEATDTLSEGAEDFYKPSR